MLQEVISRDASLWAVIWAGHREKPTVGPVVCGDIYVRAAIISAVVTVVLAEGAEKILVLHHQPSWHTLLTVHTGNVHKLALVGVLIDVASKFTNPLTSKLLIGTPNFKLSHFTWNLVVLEKAVCFPANWTNLTFLVSLGNARRAKVMPTGCQLRVT